MSSEGQDAYPHQYPVFSIDAKPEEQHAPKEPPTRREVMSAIASGGMLGTSVALSFKVRNVLEAKKSRAYEAGLTHEQRVEEISKEVNAEPQIPDHEKHLYRKVSMHGLEGQYLGGIAAKYFDWTGDKSHVRVRDDLGIEKVVLKPLPATLTINPAEVSKKLWDEKNTRHPDAFNEAIAKWMMASYKKVLREGKEHTCTLEQLIGHANHLAEQTHQALDWKRVGELYNLSDRGTKILSHLAARITGKALVGYAMTETVSTGGEPMLAPIALDTTLRELGTEFLIRIPALYDKQPSWGPWQVTPNALNEGPNMLEPVDAHGKHPMEYRGASKINRAMPENMRLPPDILGLESIDDHIKTAYLFAVNNVGEAVHALSARPHKISEVAPAPPTHKTHAAAAAELAHKIKEQRALDRLAGMSQETLIEFISTSHHQPSRSREILLNFLRQEGAAPYRTFCTDHLQTYADRTQQNYTALDQYALTQHLPKRV